MAHLMAMNMVLQFCFFHAFRVLCNGQGINHRLDVTAQESLQVVRRIADAMVRHAALWEVVGTDFRTSVARRHQTLTARGDVVHILLMLLVIYKGIQARESAFLVFGLVARLGTLDEDLLRLARIRVLPHIAQADTRFHLVHVLTTGTATSEGVPLDFTLVDMHLKLISSGSTATVAAEVCMRPCVSVAGTRCTR